MKDFSNLTTQVSDVPDISLLQSLRRVLEVVNRLQAAVTNLTNEYASTYVQIQVMKYSEEGDITDDTDPNRQSQADSVIGQSVAKIKAIINELARDHQILLSDSGSKVVQTAKPLPAVPSVYVYLSTGTTSGTRMKALRGTYNGAFPQDYDTWFVERLEYFAESGNFQTALGWSTLKLEYEAEHQLRQYTIGQHNVKSLLPPIQMIVRNLTGTNDSSYLLFQTVQIVDASKLQAVLYGETQAGPKVLAKSSVGGDLPNGFTTWSFTFHLNKITSLATLEQLGLSGMELMPFENRCGAFLSTRQNSVIDEAWCPTTRVTPSTLVYDQAVIASSTTIPAINDSIQGVVDYANGINNAVQSLM